MATDGLSRRWRGCVVAAVKAVPTIRGWKHIKTVTELPVFTSDRRDSSLPLTRPGSVSADSRRRESTSHSTRPSSSLGGAPRFPNPDSDSD